MTNPLLIDLWTHIVPLEGDLIQFSSSEVMHTEHDLNSNSRLWYVKNANAEEFWLANGGIWRGRDTSHGNNTYYDTYTNESRNIYGHVWLPRVVEVGATYTERAYTVIKRKDTHAEQAAYDATYRIEIGYHTTLKLPSDITLPRVVQLIDRNADGMHYESKYYAHNHGLVWWRDELRSVETFMTGTERRKPTLARDTFGLPDVSVEDDPATPYPKDLQRRVTISATVPALRIRSAPSLTAPVVGYFGATLETHTNDALVIDRDNYTWRPFERLDACVVWAADEFLQVDYHTDPDPTPEPPEPQPQPDGCIPQLLSRIGVTMPAQTINASMNSYLTNPALAEPYTQTGNIHQPQGWGVAVSDFPGTVSERGNVWARPDARGYSIESGQAQFIFTFGQTIINLPEGHYTVGFDFQPDITPLEIGGDGVRVKYSDDYFQNIVIDSVTPFYASDTPAERGVAMQHMDLQWVNDYPSTGFDDHSHKARILTLARYITLTQPATLRITFGVGSKWGRSAGKTYIKGTYVNKRADTPTPTPTDPDGCLTQLRNLLRI